MTGGTQAIAQAVALTFMGTRAEKWPKDRWNAMGFFQRQQAAELDGS